MILKTIFFLYDLAYTGLHEIPQTRSFTEDIFDSSDRCF